MKRFRKILLISIVASFCLAIAAIAQDAPAAGGRGGMGGMGAGRGGAGAGRGMFGGRRRGFDTESISAAVTAIEKQINAIKKILAEAAEETDAAGAAGAARGARGAEGAGGMDFQAMMTAMRERTAMVQEATGAIANQCLVLDSTPLQTEVTELQAALTQANAEEAKETAALIQAMITARQEKAQELGIRIRGARGARGGAGRGGMGGRGGDYTPPPGGFQYND